MGAEDSSDVRTIISADDFTWEDIGNITQHSDSCLAKDIDDYIARVANACNCMISIDYEDEGEFHEALDVRIKEMMKQLAAGAIQAKEMEEANN